MNIHYHRLEGFQGIETIPGIKSYAKRAAVLCNPDDILLIDDYPGLEIPIPELELLHEAGLGPKAENIFAVDFDSQLPWEQNIDRNREVLEKLKELQANELMPFSMKPLFIKDLVEHLALDCHRSTSELAFWAEDKYTLIELHEKLGNVPQGFLCRTLPEYIEAWQKLKSLPNFPGQAVIKARQSASGLLSSVVRNEDDIRKFLATYPLEDGVIEEWWQSHVSPSINYWIRDEEIEELFISDQLFENALPSYGESGTCIYRGNICPSNLPSETQARISEIAKPFAEYFHAQGYRGPVGFDMVIFEDKIFLVEANPRVTGPHYGYFPAKRKNAKAFHVCNQTIDKKYGLKELRDALGDLFLLDGQSKGYYIFNYSPGKFTGVLLGSTRDELEVMQQELQIRLASLKN